MPATTSTTLRRLPSGMARTALPLPLLLLLACSSATRFGDADGVPVAIDVVLDPGYLAGIERDPEHAAAAGSADQAHGGSGPFALLGSEAVGEGEVFRKEVGMGESSFAVPLEPGHRLDLALALGGGGASAALGTIAIPRQPPIRISIRLDRSGSRVAVGDGLGRMVERHAPRPVPMAPARSQGATPRLDEPTVLPPPPRPLN